MPIPKQALERNRKLGQLAAPSVGLCIILSLFLHLIILTAIFFEWPAAVLESLGVEIRDEETATLPQREEIVMVQLMGNTSQATPEAPEVEAEDPPPPPAPEPEAETSPQEAAEAVPAPTDAIPLGRLEDRPKAPELARQKTPPPQVSPPPVEKPREPTPPRRDAQRTQPPKRNQPPPSGFYQRTMGTLGRDANLTLGAIGGNVNDPVIRSYYNLIMRRFKANWRAPANSEKFNLAAVYSITIEVDGRISRIQLTRSSGNPAFDRSAEQALRKSSPLPPLPAIFAGRRDHPSFRFGSQED